MNSASLLAEAFHSFSGKHKQEIIGGVQANEIFPRFIKRFCNLVYI